MAEQVEAQRLLEASLRKISSTKQALGNSEVQAHARIDDMLAYIRHCMGTGMEALPRVRPLLLAAATAPSALRRTSEPAPMPGRSET